MTRRSVGLARASGREPDPFDTDCALMSDDDLLYLAIAMAKRKALNAESFLMGVGTYLEFLKELSRPTGRAGACTSINIICRH